MPATEERLASLEARVDTIAEIKPMIAEMRSDMHDLGADMNRQFRQVHDDFRALDQKVDHHFVFLIEKTDRQFTRLVGFQVALLLAVVGALVGA